MKNNRNIKSQSAFITIVVLAASMLTPQSSFAAVGDVTTFMSGVFGRNNISKTSNYAYLDFPEDVTLDRRNGEMYIADTYNNAIRRITKDGLITMFAGTGHFGDGTGPRTLAKLAEPKGVAMSANGDVYIADTGNNKIKKSHLGTVSVVASGLHRPQGILASKSRLFIADTEDNSIKWIFLSGGPVHTLTTGGSISKPRKMTISPDDKTLFVASTGSHRVVAVNTQTGAQSVVAGSGNDSYVEGIGTGASFQTIWGITKVADSLYVTDGNGSTDRIRKIDLTTKQTTLFASDANMASLNFPAGIISDASNIYVANSGLGTIYRFAKSNPFGNQGIYAGSDRFENNDATGKGNANIGRPWDIAKASGDSNYLYVAENNKISEIFLPTVQRTAIWGNSVDNYKESTGSVGRASTISSLAVNSSRSMIYFTDTWNNRIRMVNIATRTSSRLSGIGNTNTIGRGNSYVEGAADVAKFDNPRGIAISPDNSTLYISDTSNARIRRVNTSTGTTSFIAGQSSEGFVNGKGSAAKFNRPMGIAVDSSNTFAYVADSKNHVIRRVRLSDGNVDTLAGAGRAGYRDGVGTNSVFSLPEYVTYDNGNLYVSEAGGYKIRKIKISTREVTTLAGTRSAKGYLNGNRDAAQFNDPKGMVAVGKNLYVADSKNDVIRKIITAN